MYGRGPAAGRCGLPALGPVSRVLLHCHHRSHRCRGGARPSLDLRFFGDAVFEALAEGKAELGVRSAGRAEVKKVMKAMKK